jgi:hypothetical protein
VLSNPRGIFGVHSVSPYSLVDGSFYGTLKVVKSASLNFSGSTIPLKGGSNKSPWAVEEGEINCGLSLKVGEYPDFLFKLFQGLTVTENSPDASGNVSTLTNKLNSSVMHATTGIASVLAISGSEGDLKFGKYVVIAASATTVNVYAASDVDFQRGTSGVFQGDALTLVAAAVTITASAATNITGFGFKLTGGSGTIGMTTGDSATFEVRPKNTASLSGVLGQSGAVFPEFGAIIMAKKRGNGEMVEIDAYRCKGEGFPINFDENKWSEADIKVQLMYDSVQNGYARIRAVTPTTPN